MREGKAGREKYGGRKLERGDEKYMRNGVGRGEGSERKKLKLRRRIEVEDIIHA